MFSAQMSMITPRGVNHLRVLAMRLAFGNDQPMTRRTLRDSTTVAVEYIAGAGILATAAYFAIFLTPVLAGASATFLLALLGPLAFGLMMILSFAINTAFDDVSVALVASVFAVTTALAAVNLLIAFVGLPALAKWAGEPERYQQARLRSRAIAAVLFVTAGFAFVALCVASGAVALIVGSARENDPSQGAGVIVLAAAAWLVGLLVALTGLLVWIVDGVRTRPIVVWAAAVLVVQLGLIAGLMAVSG